MNVHRFELRAPIWGGRKNMKIGIAAFRFDMADYVEVKCLYRDKKDTPLFPRVFRIASLKGRRFPAKPQKGTMIHEIPIGEYEEVKKE